MNATDLVVLAIGLVAPIVVGLVTKSSTSSGLKACLLAAIAALVGVGTGFVNTSPGQVWDWRAATVAAAVAWVAAVATHYGFYKPTGVTARIQSTAISD